VVVILSETFTDRQHRLHELGPPTRGVERYHRELVFFESLIEGKMQFTTDAWSMIVDTGREISRHCCEIQVDPRRANYVSRIHTLALWRYELGDDELN
jgi:hypothetical protein